ncbi:MAG: hypothetical protein JRD88_02335, partial [Deltaproteobacteria bacterium]|nr:hypothetical protein [Deltaproteobacteria bacterium]
MSDLFRKEYRPTLPIEKSALPSFDGIDWDVSSGNALTGVETALHDSDSCVLVKQNVKRKVFRCKDLYIKETGYRGIRRFLKGISGGSAFREKEMNQALKQLGVNVPEVVAYGRQKAQG